MRKAPSKFTRSHFQRKGIPIARVACITCGASKLCLHGGKSLKTWENGHLCNRAVRESVVLAAGAAEMQTEITRMQAALDAMRARLAA